jgi:hypothetical protein
MFCIAKDGLKTNSQDLHESIPSRKRYYNGLNKLKKAGLIERSNIRGTYYHR